MPEAPAFFVPNARPEAQEEAYANLARFAHQPVAPVGERIYSITFHSNMQEWTATVGELLYGHTLPPRRRPSAHQRAVQDSARVLAIFAAAEPAPHIVVTDAGINPRVASALVNPFMAGRPGTVT